MVTYVKGPYSGGMPAPKYAGRRGTEDVNNPIIQAEANARRRDMGMDPRADTMMGKAKREADEAKMLKRTEKAYNDSLTSSYKNGGLVKATRTSTPIPWGGGKTHKRG